MVNWAGNVWGRQVAVQEKFVFCRRSMLPRRLTTSHLNQDCLRCWPLPRKHQMVDRSIPDEVSSRLSRTMMARRSHFQEFWRCRARPMNHEAFGGDKTARWLSLREGHDLITNPPNTSYWLGFLDQGWTKHSWRASLRDGRVRLLSQEEGSFSRRKSLKWNWSTKAWTWPTKGSKNKPKESPNRNQTEAVDSPKKHGRPKEARTRKEDSPEPVNQPEPWRCRGRWWEITWTAKETRHLLGD